MKTEIIGRIGQVIGIEANMNGRRRLDLRLWRLATDEPLHADTTDLVSARERETLVAALPEDCRPEAAELLLEIADEVVARRQNGSGALPPSGSATLQPSSEPVDRAELWEACRHLATDPRILDRVVEATRSLGVVGAERYVKVGYLVMTSRLLDPPARPVSLAIKGPSAAGKSFPLEQLLKLFPPEAFYEFTAMSERALAYGEEPLAHRMLVVYEAAGLSGDVGSYLVRSLLSEGRLRYETVVKTEDGLKTQRIERDGPTGLITTTTRVALHPENETRLLSLTVTDSPLQTRAVMRALASLTRMTFDPSPWHALQRYVETGVRQVEIPFAGALAELVPTSAVRLRRDFGTLLNLIRAHAVLHQETRERDEQGRIIATLDDYAVVRELVADLMAEGVGATVSKTVRQTVAIVREHGDSQEGMTVTALAALLRLDKSATLRRAQTAIEKGYLRNLETGRGRPARLIVGDPLPEEVELLPSPEQLLEGCKVADLFGGIVGADHAQQEELAPASHSIVTGASDDETAERRTEPHAPSDGVELGDAWEPEVVV